jgi:hypothetical protein
MPGGIRRASDAGSSVTFTHVTFPPDPCHGDDKAIFQQAPDVSLDRLLLGQTPGGGQVVGVAVPEVAVKAQAHDPVIGGLD